MTSPGAGAMASAWRLRLVVLAIGQRCLGHQGTEAGSSAASAKKASCSSVTTSSAAVASAARHLGQLPLEHRPRHRTSILGRAGAQPGRLIDSPPMRRLLLLAFIWGWSFLFIKVAVEGMSPPPWRARASRSARRVLLVVLRAQRTRRPPPSDRGSVAPLRDARGLRQRPAVHAAGWGEERITSALDVRAQRIDSPVHRRVTAVLFGERLSRAADRRAPPRLRRRRRGRRVRRRRPRRLVALGRAGGRRRLRVYGFAFVYAHGTSPASSPSSRPPGSSWRRRLLLLPFAAVTSSVRRASS